MENLFLYLAMVTFYLIVTNLLFYCHAIESPNYAVVHKEIDFEIRLYKDVSWMSAQVRDTSFQLSTKDGFHRLYQYVHGANYNSTTLPITTPVLTSVSKSQNGSLNYSVRLFLAENYGATPPQPNTDLNLQFERWTERCLAVRIFSGFANDDSISKEVKGLVSSLDAAVLQHKVSYSIAQYNASSYQTGRLNEVWMHVTQGCRTTK